MLKLEILFNAIVKKFEYLRKHNKNVDGLSLWQPLKQILSSLDHYSAEKFKHISFVLTDKIMNLPEYTKNGYGIDTIIESNHFIIQQIRIPMKDKPTIKKILQLALNIGQWKGYPDNTIYKYIDYTNTNLDKLSRYIFSSDIIKLSNLISDDIYDKIMNYLDTL